MKIKYFQPLADIENHYDDILRYFDDARFGEMLLKTWDITLTDKDDIIEEREVVRYLVSCGLMMARGENVKKPKIHVVNRCFNRHLSFLEKIHGIHAYNVNKHRSKLTQKAYKACRHYLFKFSLPAWYEKLPEEILTFENKYPHHKL